MTSRPKTSLQYGCWTGTDANLSADSLIEGTGVLPVYYRQDRCTTSILQTGQVYRQYRRTDSTGVQYSTGVRYSTGNLYSTGVQTVQVYRQYSCMDSTGLKTDRCTDSTILQHSMVVQYSTIVQCSKAVQYSTVVQGVPKKTLDRV